VRPCQSLRGEARSADAEQTDALLEPKIYRLARLEILVIRKELEDKRRRVRPAARQRGVINC
jgi:hypothetical protein